MPSSSDWTPRRHGSRGKHLQVGRLGAYLLYMPIALLAVIAVLPFWRERTPKGPRH